MKLNLKSFNLTFTKINQIEMKPGFLLAHSDDRFSEQALKVQWMGERIRSNIHVKTL